MIKLMNQCFSAATDGGKKIQKISCQESFCSALSWFNSKRPCVKTFIETFWANKDTPPFGPSVAACSKKLTEVDAETSALAWLAS